MIKPAILVNTKIHLMKKSAQLFLLHRIPKSMHRIDTYKMKPNPKVLRYMLAVSFKGWVALLSYLEKGRLSPLGLRPEFIMPLKKGSCNIF